MVREHVSFLSPQAARIQGTVRGTVSRATERGTSVAGGGAIPRRWPLHHASHNEQVRLAPRAAAMSGRHSDVFIPHELRSQGGK